MFKTTIEIYHSTKKSAEALSVVIPLTEKLAELAEDRKPLVRFQVDGPYGLVIHDKDEA